MAELHHAPEASLSVKHHLSTTSCIRRCSEMATYGALRGQGQSDEESNTESSMLHMSTYYVCISSSRASNIYACTEYIRTHISGREHMSNKARATHQIIVANDYRFLETRRSRSSKAGWRLLATQARTFFKLSLWLAVRGLQVCFEQGNPEKPGLSQTASFARRLLLFVSAEPTYEVYWMQPGWVVASPER
jgi:hypothetical protein